MIHVVASTGFIIVAIVVGFGLAALVAVTVANAMAVRQGRKGRESRQEPPQQYPDSASFKRGA